MRAHHRRQCSWIVAAASLLWSPWESARAAEDRYELSGDTATDRLTGLTWQTKVDWDVEYDWDGAKSHCRNLGQGWRMPSFKELLTLVDPRRAQPAIDTTVFPYDPTIVAATFWTASPFLPEAGKAWTVHFEDGGTEGLESSIQLYVRCVR